MYFGLVIPILTIMNTFVFGLKQEGKGKIQELSKRTKGLCLLVTMYTLWTVHG